MNHQAIIARVDKTEEIPGATAIQVAYVLGEAVIVSKDVGVGYVGVFFPTDLQLSEEYCHNNNLYHDSTKNKDVSKKGFFDDNRRVRAQTFMKVKSCGYFADISSILYAVKSKEDIAWPVGMQFDEVEGTKICQKYISEQTRKVIQGKSKTSKKLEVPFFEKHVDTEQFLYNLQNIKKGDLITVTAKIHGSSARVAKLKRNTPLPKWKQLVNKVVSVFTEKSDYQMVVGTRNVVIDDGTKVGYHGPEQWRMDMASEIYPYLEGGMTVFAELYGWANGSKIMPSHDVTEFKNKEYIKKYGKTVDFTYGCKEYELKWMVYRITRLSVSGENVDMTQRELEKWCSLRSLPCSLQVCDQFVFDGDHEALKEKIIALSERPQLLAECYINPKAYGEGVVIRVENGNTTPNFYKYKNFYFKVGESICEDIDMETIS